MSRSFITAVDRRAGERVRGREAHVAAMRADRAPGKSCAIWVNSERFNNFHDLGNRPAVPYLIAFQTIR
jgi:hypothetical protein